MRDGARVAIGRDVGDREGDGVGVPGGKVAPVPFAATAVVGAEVLAWLLLVL